LRFQHARTRDGASAGATARRDVREHAINATGEARGRREPRRVADDAAGSSKNQLHAIDARR